MAGKVLPITLQELQASLDKAGPPTARRRVDHPRRPPADSMEAVLAWWAEVEADLAAGRLIELEDGTRG